MSEEGPDKRTGAQFGRGKRMGLMIAGFVVAVLGIAWIHGGEQPLRSIVQPIETPVSEIPASEIRATEISERVQ